MPKNLTLIVVLDDVLSLNPVKDTSFALMLEAQNRGYTIYCLDTHQLSLDKNKVVGEVLEVVLTDNSQDFVRVIRQKTLQLSEASLVIMRKDPPFDMNYIYATYLLEMVENTGVVVLNKPQSLRDFNEKLAIMQFPDCITNTLISSNTPQIQDFLSLHKTIVIKPLDGMGGRDIYKLSHKDDATKIIETITKLTQKNTPLMAQKFLPEISQGDKRIIIINGKPIPYSLARIPAEGNFKGNLAQGAVGIAQPLSKRDEWLCAQISQTLINKGLFFVGLDVIGDYITEINVTSPTGVRELDKQCNLNIAYTFFEEIA